MSRMWSVAGVAALAWLSLGSLAGAAEFPGGTFTASPQKDQSIQFGDGGKFTVLSGGKVAVEGTYTASATEGTLTDEKGPFAAKEPDARTGKYRWKLQGGRLTFRLVEDKSKGRELLLTMNEWAEPK